MQLYLVSIFLDNGGYCEGVVFIVGIGFNWYQFGVIYFYLLNDFVLVDF